MSLILDSMIEALKAAITAGLSIFYEIKRKNNFQKINNELDEVLKKNMLRLLSHLFIW